MSDSIPGASLQTYSATSGLQHEEPLLFEHAHEDATSIALPGIEGDISPELATFARKDRDHVKTDYRRVFEIFPRLEERKSQASGTLSGGEQQMLAIGRAFMSGRRLMLLDEPSMGLSPLLMMNVFQALKEINRQEGTAILLVEQNARLALKFSKKGYVLENGNLVLEGDSETLINDPEVKKAYLGG